MIAPDRALALIAERVRPLRAERVPLAKAAGRVLAEDVRAAQDLPPFDNSAMDGYAVRLLDCDAEALPILSVIETLRAGAGGRPKVGPGQAIRIMTGAPLPEGADTVIPKEAAEERNGTVKLLRRPASGAHIRRRGEDVRAGARLLQAGAKLRPYEIALLAAQGEESVPVIRRPRVSVLATGNELAAGAAGGSFGRIRDSNGPALCAAVARWGATPAPQGVAADEPAMLKVALRQALRDADALLVSGGVSVGDFDFTKSALDELGIELVFWRVAIKPGRPLLFGLLEGKPVFGLPGNPVAALVCAEEFVRPALERLQGHSPRHRSYHLIGTALNDYPSPEDRLQYLFCRARRGDAGHELQILRPQGSAMLGMASSADALAVSPLGRGRIRAGDQLAFRWLK
ncbi:MAG: molybdopterin molybdotransferase MoeA [Elusimicrobia bacterium]|nr:molybdopterin molybdotransferase MoeA [Elusimicrobiota bacterium]